MSWLPRQKTPLSLRRRLGFADSSRRNRHGTRYLPALEGMEQRALLTSGPSTVFVDAHAVGTPDGTKQHPYPTIQQGVNVASPGGTVIVAAGLYNESVTVNKTLTIDGADGGKEGVNHTGPADPNRESIVQPPAGAGFDVAAGNVVIDGFTVQEALGVPGIQLSSSFSGYVVRDNVINANPNNGVGIQFGSSGIQKSVIEHNFFYGSADRGGSQVDAISAIPGLQNAEISHNTFFRNDSAGVVIVQSLGPNSGIEIDHNDSIEDGSLVALFNAPGTSIDHNTIVRSSGSAIFIGSGNNGASISHNQISGAKFRGIRIDAPEFGGRASANMIIDHNHIRKMAGAGISVAPNSLVNSLIDHNQVQNNSGGGISIEAGGNGGNVIGNNQLKHNGDGVTTFDARDDTTGTGTAGTANTWVQNEGQTSSPPGLLKKRGS